MAHGDDTTTRHVCKVDPDDRPMIVWRFLPRLWYDMEMIRTTAAGGFVTAYCTVSLHGMRRLAAMDMDIDIQGYIHVWISD